MHDLDRALMELDANNDSEFDDVDSDPDFDRGEDIQGIASDDAEELELTFELVDATTDEELERTIRRAMDRRGKRRPGPAARRPGGRPRVPPPPDRRRRRRRKAGGFLKNLVQKALPAAGSILGGAVPIVGPAIGRAAGRAAAKVLAPELEGLSPEDQEFETARRIVRIAGDTEDLLNEIDASVPDEEAAKAAVVASSRKHLPGAVRRRQRAGSQGPVGDSGRWIRRGKQIILMGV